MNFYILFSPSESKNFLQNHNSNLHAIKNLDSKAVHSYIHTLNTADEKTLSHIFGGKMDLNALSVATNWQDSSLSKAISLYSGVAYRALDLDSLGSQAKSFIDKRVWIFSNLFGGIRADTLLPYYNLHQGKGIAKFSLKNVYAECKDRLDSVFSDCVLIDLRAKAYIKQYNPESIAKHIFLVEFIKNNKVLSHYSKFYRGLYLRALAMLNVKKISCVKDLMDIYIQNLRFKESKTTSNTTMLIYEILE